jgi:sulfatase modifying factor 1
MQARFQKAFIALVLFVGIYPALAQTTLGIAPVGNQTVLFWPTSATNYVLQSTTNLATPNWVAVSNGVPMTAISVTNTTSAIFFRLSTPVIPAGMVLIPAGTFTMGDTLDGESDAVPSPVTVSAFYMDTNLVTYNQWVSIYNWATSNGYAFDDAGSGKAPNHPVQALNWYDTVKWCNARSQQAGLTPAYYTDAALTQVYTNGDTNAVYVNWATTGYRLPTEAEWEKAARGGLSGLRFPWGNTISESQANYSGDTNDYSYDLGPNGYNPIGSYGGTSPATSPVGSFAPNGFGLYDMAGNVQEWCWDWYAPYVGGTDPHGPTSGSKRVLRGGNWESDAIFCRCADRVGLFTPNRTDPTFGFRCVCGF